MYIFKNPRVTIEWNLNEKPKVQDPALYGSCYRTALRATAVIGQRAVFGSLEKDINIMIIIFSYMFPIGFQVFIIPCPTSNVSL